CSVTARAQQAKPRIGVLLSGGREPVGNSVVRPCCTRSGLFVAQTCRLSRCSNSRQLLRVLQTLSRWDRRPISLFIPARAGALATGGGVLCRARGGGRRVAATSVSRVWDRHRKADRGREPLECAGGRPRP